MTPQEAIEAADLAIKALEKQIPKKPIIATNMMTKEKGICCPNCETWYNRFYENKKYCMECGQRLKWSDEE